MLTTDRLLKIRELTRKLLEGCIIVSDSGIKLYTPDGKANYTALWTRDFAYMVEDAGELLEMEDVRLGIEYLMKGMREDGWVPDRVYKDGVAFYTAGPGNFPASPNLDNGCFLCLLADAYLTRLAPQAAMVQFLSWKDALCRAIDCLPTAQNGLILNHAEPPHSPYGFTDTVCKTGLLCMETLLLWNAKRKLIAWLQTCDCPTDKYERDLAAMEQSFIDAFLQCDGTLRAATECCAQTDLWAMCYAVSIGFPLPESVRLGMADWLIAHYDGIVQAGQLRHLPAGEYWEKTFNGVPHGSYQNGAFWATPIKWLCDVLRLRDAALATQTLKDALDYVETYGCYECVNGEDRRLDTYVASATALYGAAKREQENVKSVG